MRVVAPRDMPKLGRGGSLQSRQALVHSLVHTESWAIDLSWVSSQSVCFLIYEVYIIPATFFLVAYEISWEVMAACHPLYGDGDRLIVCR